MSLDLGRWKGTASRSRQTVLRVKPCALVKRLSDRLVAAEFVGNALRKHWIWARGNGAEAVSAVLGRLKGDGGGMSPVMVKELRASPKENARLRKVMADQALDIAILKEVASRN